MRGFLPLLYAAARAAGASGVAGAGPGLAAVHLLLREEPKSAPTEEESRRMPEPSPSRSRRWERISWPRARALTCSADGERSLRKTPISS